MRPLYCVLVLFVALAGVIPLDPSRSSQVANQSTAVGVHTIRADDTILQLAAQGGFNWLVQLVEWREVEPVPGDYFWEYADWLVRGATYYDLELVLRLDHAPEWALATDAGMSTDIPIDVQAYTRFVARVADRYRGRVRAYVIWNEPNLAVEWAGGVPNPAGYVELLCAAGAAIHEADPAALVVSTGLAPTNHNDDTALDDRLYLEAMYAAGAASCFDVLGAHPYGFAYPADDAHGAHDGLNFSRLVDLRQIMVEQGDGAKPVWATELGWTTAAAGPERQWLQVSEEQQASYLIAAAERAGRAWPWLERMAVWNLSSGLPEGDEKGGYSLLRDDGSPKPAYDALSAWLGEHQAGVAEDQGTEEAPAPWAEILAPDVAVRLSDVDTFYPHWARPHCKGLPCRRWQGTFYVREPGVGPWWLCLEIMQVEEPGNRVWINGHLLDPPAIPLRGRPDFASVWTAVEMPVLAELLQSGVNLIEIESSPRLPVYQDSWAHFESLQFRHVRLVTDS